MRSPSPCLCVNKIDSFAGLPSQRGVSAFAASKLRATCGVRIEHATAIGEMSVLSRHIFFVLKALRQSTIRVSLRGALFSGIADGDAEVT